ncbi:MAG: hypothetical protein ACYCXK_09840 [Candidatus Humimicrobiaceae bacterium]
MLNIKIPRMIYHQDAVFPINIPASDATTANAVKFTAIPRAKTRDSLNAFLALNSAQIG